VKYILVSCIKLVFFFIKPKPSSLVQQPILNQGLLIVQTSHSHSGTPLLVGLLWTRDKTDAETSTWQHTTLTNDRHPCPRRDSN